MSHPTEEELVVVRDGDELFVAPSIVVLLDEPDGDEVLTVTRYTL